MHCLLWIDALFIVNFFGFCLFLFVKLPGAETLFKKVRNQQYLTLKFKLIFSGQVPAEATKMVLNLLIFVFGWGAAPPCLPPSPAVHCPCAPPGPAAPGPQLGFSVFHLGSFWCLCDAPRVLPSRLLVMLQGGCPREKRTVTLSGSVLCVWYYHMY